MASRKEAFFHLHQLRVEGNLKRIYVDLQENASLFFQVVSQHVCPEPQPVLVKQSFLSLKRREKDNDFEQDRLGTAVRRTEKRACFSHGKVRFGLAEDAGAVLFRAALVLARRNELSGKNASLWL